MMPTNLPPETETALRSELNSGEKLLWAGQPIAGRAGLTSLPLVLFGIPWTLFSIFWIVMASGITSRISSGFGVTSLFPLFGIPFVLIGVGMLSSPLWMRRKAQRTIYAVTDTRALILTPAWGGGVTVRSIPPEDLTARSRTQKSDGSGSLIFNRLSTTRHRAGPDGGTYTVTVGFENITEVREVEALIERTFQPFV
jgi:hypothetical protein